MDRGRTMEEAMKEVNMVVEGVYSAKAGLELSREIRVEMPIIQQVNRVLFEGKNPAEAVKELMVRDKKIESWDSAWEGEKNGAPFWNSVFIALFYVGNHIFRDSGNPLSCVHGCNGCHFFIRKEKNQKSGCFPLVVPGVWTLELRQSAAERASGVLSVPEFFRSVFRFQSSEDFADRRLLPKEHMPVLRCRLPGSRKAASGD